MLTFNQFQATANAATIEEAATRLQWDRENFGNAARVWFYQDDCFLSESPDGSFIASIYNQEWTGTRGQMERVLYDEFYLSECCAIAEPESPIPASESLLDQACDKAESRAAKLSQIDVIRLALPIAAKAGLYLTHDGETLRFEIARPFETDATRIARAFSWILWQDIGEEHLQEAIARNATPAYAAACATHDFCDANMPMSEAFLMVTGRDILADVESDAALWNQAWQIARDNGFFLTEETDLLDRATAAPDLDSACLIIQEASGQTDGGIAGMYFSDIEPEEWQAMPEHDRRARLSEYLQAEISFKESAQ